MTTRVTHDRITRKKRRIRARIAGTSDKPRIAVFRSNKYIYAQAIDDVAQMTIAAASSFAVKKSAKKQTKRDDSKEVGIELAKKLIAKKITHGVFDRSRFSYNGRVRHLAEGMREAGFII